MTAQKHVVVVGAGIVGASIAWHLVSAGARVTVVDAGAAGGIATLNSFAWINASWGNPEPYFRLRIRAMAEWNRLVAAVPEIPLTFSGGLLFDLPAEKLQAYAEEHAGWGYGIRRVERAEIVRIEPNLANPPEIALHVAEEGAVEPNLAANMLLQDATNRGARFMAALPALRLIGKAGAVSGVETVGGPIEADEVVLAAGTGTLALAATVGIKVPMSTPPGLLVYSRPHARLLNGLVLAPELHMRQSAHARIVAGADYAGTDPGADPEATAAALFAATKARLLNADDLAFDFLTVGERPTPIDGFPIVGRPPGVAGLYLAVTHSGITLAPAIGLFAADELLTGRRDPLLSPYGPERFA